MGNRLPDAYLKEMLLRDHATRREMQWEDFTKTATIIDDNYSVLARLGQIGIRAVHADALNDALR